jgi:hypothetical protein
VPRPAPPGTTALRSVRFARSMPIASTSRVAAVLALSAAVSLVVMSNVLVLSSLTPTLANRHWRCLSPTATVSPRRKGVDRSLVLPVYDAPSWIRSSGSLLTLCSPVDVRERRWGVICPQCTHPRASLPLPCQLGATNSSLSPEAPYGVLPQSGPRTTTQILSFK